MKPATAITVEPPATIVRPAPLLLDSALLVPALNPSCVLLGLDRLTVLLLVAVVSVVGAALAVSTPAATVTFVGIPVMTPLLSVSVR
jgi:hypothetical protein